MDEFALIDTFFNKSLVERNEVILGIGDDAACVRVPSGFELLMSTDTLVAEVHFLSQWDPYDIACKAVRVNVSDIAAMGAEPCWVTLALTIPQLNENWLERFSQGFHDSLRLFNIMLIGGDTTKGPLSLTLSIYGLAPIGQAIYRHGAKPDDVIYVSGELGAAALAVESMNREELAEEEKIILMQKLQHPNPRVDLAEILRNHASAAIDISDGLSADLNHICKRSGVGACLQYDAIPVHPIVEKYKQQHAVEFALTGGDDYELCFTVAPRDVADLDKELIKFDLNCYPIGKIEKDRGLRIMTKEGTLEKFIVKGYNHFNGQRP